MSLLAYIDACSGIERRGSPRAKLRLATQGEAAASGGSAQVVIHDISATGLLVEWRQHLTAGECIEVELPGQGSTRAVIVWTSGLFAGCQFDVPIAPLVVDAALRESERKPERRFDQGTITEIASQLDDLSMAVGRITRILDRAISELTRRGR